MLQLTYRSPLSGDNMNTAAGFPCCNHSSSSYLPLRDLFPNRFKSKRRGTKSKCISKGSFNGEYEQELLQQEKPFSVFIWEPHCCSETIFKSYESTFYSIQTPAPSAIATHLGAWLTRGSAWYRGKLYVLNSSLVVIPGQVSSVGVPVED